MNKTLNIIKSIVTWLLIITSVLMVVFTIFSTSVLGKNKGYVFGYKAYIVQSDSMKSVNGDESKGHFKAGDLIFSKKVNPDTLERGDIITFISTNAENYGEIITHMIKSKTTTINGETAFITYGTATGVEDSKAVTYSYVLGKYVSRLKGVGNFFAYLKTIPGYMLCVFTPLFLLICVQTFESVRLFKQRRIEQAEEELAGVLKEKEELSRERQALEKERKENEQLLKKLQENQTDKTKTQQDESQKTEEN